MRDWIDQFEISDLGPWAFSPPWEVTAKAEPIIDDVINTLHKDDWIIDNFIAVHKTAVIETGAILKPPVVIGPNCFVAAFAYLRGGVWLQQDCTIGPSCEVKSSFLFKDASIAHLNFIGDSIIGADVNIEAGVIIANHRNELDDPRIKIEHRGQIIDTCATKFGALIGDRAKIGANAVIAPGALLAPNSITARMAHVDQSPSKKAPIGILS